MATQTRRSSRTVSVIAMAMTLLLSGALLASPPNITQPVTDLTDALSPQETSSLTDALVRLREETAVQMAVMVIDTTGDVPIADYAQTLFDQWKGGDAERDDGLLLVLAMADRRSRLHTGYGLEGRISDATARRLLDAMKPHLRDGDTHGAILGLIQSVGPLAQGITPPGTWTSNQAIERPKENAGDIAIAYVFLMLGAFVIAYWTHLSPRPQGVSWSAILPRIRRRWWLTRATQWLLIPLLLWPLMPGPWAFGAVLIIAMISHAAITRVGLALGARDRMFWVTGALAMVVMAVLFNEPIGLVDATLSDLNVQVWTLVVHATAYLVMVTILSLLALVQLGWDFPRLSSEEQDERLQVRKQYRSNAASWTEAGYQGHTISSSGIDTDFDFGSASDFSSTSSSSSFSSSSSWGGGGGFSGGGGASSSW
jgi:uncharacterized protein